MLGMKITLTQLPSHACVNSDSNNLCASLDHNMSLVVGTQDPRFHKLLLVYFPDLQDSCHQPIKSIERMRWATAQDTRLYVIKRL